EVLGLAWDGTGLGTDGTIWGGEALVFAGGRVFERIASLRAFPLPGGDHAARSPRLSALGALHALVPEGLERHAAVWSTEDASALRLDLVRQRLARRLNAPLCSSVGRLFDAAAALLGLVTIVSYEGQA